MRRLAALTLALAAVFSSRAAACDLCMAPPPEFTTVQSELQAAETVVLAERTKAAAAERAGLVVRTVLRGGTDLLPGQRVDPPSAPLGAGLFLLYGDAPRFDAIPARRIGEETAQFVTIIAAAPEKDADAPEPWGRWLALLTPYLSDRDPLVSGSAGLEFAQAPFAAVKIAARATSADAALHALTDRSTPARSRGALALVVGLGGAKPHAKRLEELLRNERFRVAPGFDAVIAAYLFHRGPEGLATVQAVLQERLAEGDARTTVNVLAALRFHAANDTVLPRDDILGTVRPLLGNDAAAPAAILELAALRDWESLPAVMETYRRLRDKGPVILGPVARYVHDCPLPEAEAARAEVTRKKQEPESD